MALRIHVTLAAATLLVAVSAAPAVSATAPPALRGYYGKDYAACGADIDLLRITRRRVETRQVNCKRSDFQGTDRPGAADSFRVRGTTCIPEGQTKGVTQRFRIEQMADGAIEVFWWDGKSTGKMVKCK